MIENQDNNSTAEIQELINQLGSKKGMQRKSARKQLVEHGEKAMRALLEHHYKNTEHVFHWEVLKTMQQIGHLSSIEVFIEALEDDRSDIRWIAAEGLIKLGPHAVKPTLDALIENSDSIFVCAGAHHIFHDLKKKKHLPKDFPVDSLLSALKSPGWSGNVKSLAHELLGKL